MPRIKINDPVFRNNDPEMRFKEKKRQNLKPKSNKFKKYNSDDRDKRYR